MVANHAYEGRASTSYGALNLGADTKDDAQPKPYASNGAKLLLLAVICAVGTAAFFSGAQQGSSAKVASVVNKFKGDDLVKTGRDGWCSKPCEQPYEFIDPISKVMKKVAYGYCTAAPACLALPEGCMGIDYRLARVVEAGGDEKIACAGVEGAYDCGESWPCQNGGFCIDGYKGKTCICPFGWEGAECETDIDECAALSDGTLTKVCADNATCMNEDGMYTCTCEPGFMGDGYARDQVKIHYYSVLDTDYSYGWLHRTENDPEGKPWGDSNEDGLVDVFGCTDINDCSVNER